MDQRLRRQEHLRGAAAFARCYHHGQRLRTGYFTVYAYHRGQGTPRLGLAVGKAVGPAVVRNRVKRRLRELFRRHKALLPPGCDVFVRALPTSAVASYAALEATWCEVMSLLRRCETPNDAGCKQL